MLLLDTHTWAWSLTVDRRLPERSRDAIRQAGSCLISAVSFYEVAQKVRLGKWPIMEPFVGDLPGIAERQGMVVVRVTAETASIAGLLDWNHRDPFDRLIAATALVAGAELISTDAIFDEVSGLRRIWN